MVIVDLRWSQMFLNEWFWMIVDGFGCLQMVLGGFRRFSVICSFSNYGEIRWLKFAKVPLKFYVKRPWVGEVSFI